MSALAAVVGELLRPREHIAASKDLDKGSASFLAAEGPWLRIRTLFAPQRKAAFEAADQANPGLFFFETVSNPLRMADISGPVRAARRRHIHTPADTTFAIPLHCRPGSTQRHQVPRRPRGTPRELLRPVRSLSAAAGPTISSSDAWLILRGMVTLHVRIARAAENALRVARYPRERPSVIAVHDLAFPSDPSLPLARRFLRQGFESVVSFRVRNDRRGRQSVIRRLRRIRLFLARRPVPMLRFPITIRAGSEFSRTG